MCIMLLLIMTVVLSLKVLRQVISKSQTIGFWFPLCQLFCLKMIIDQRPLRKMVSKIDMFIFSSRIIIWDNSYCSVIKQCGFGLSYTWNKLCFRLLTVKRLLHNICDYINTSQIDQGIFFTDSFQWSYEYISCSWRMQPSNWATNVPTGEFLVSNINLHCIGIGKWLMPISGSLKMIINGYIW